MISQKIVQQELKRKGGVRFAVDPKIENYAKMVRSESQKLTKQIQEFINKVSGSTFDSANKYVKDEYRKMGKQFYQANNTMYRFANEVESWVAQEQYNAKLN